MPTQNQNAYRDKNSSGMTSARSSGSASSPRRPAESYSVYMARLQKEANGSRTRDSYTHISYTSKYTHGYNSRYNSNGGYYDTYRTSDTSRTYGGNYTLDNYSRNGYNNKNGIASSYAVPSSQRADVSGTVGSNRQRSGQAGATRTNKARLRSGRSRTVNSMKTRAVDIGMRARATASAAVSTPVPARVLSPEERSEAKKRLKTRMCCIAYVLFVALLFTFVLYRQTAIFGKNREIDSLNSQLSSVIVTNEGISSSIDKSIELGNLESVAKNKLGMINPDSSQIFYVDMGASDEVVRSASD